MRLLTTFALIFGCSVLLPSTARADCVSPEYCVCASIDPATIVDAIIQPGTGPDTVRLQVVETYGEPIELPDDGIIELPTLGQDAIHGDDAGQRALVHLEDGAVRARVLLDASENLECTELNNPMGADEGAQLALLGWEDCSTAVREREDLPSTCDDTPTCSVGSRAPVGSLMLLGLLGFLQRGRRAERTRVARPT